jgi:plasmid stabilization system protein ParE
VKQVAVLTEAAADIEAGWSFYERQESGLGSYFVRSILQDLHRLESLYGAHPMHYGLMRMLSERFPFGIYYREADDAIEVLAILDLRRDPDRIRRDVNER